MPAIRGVYDVNPRTGEAGLWVEPNWLAPGTVVGLTTAQLAANNTNAKKVTALQAALDGSKSGQVKVFANVLNQIALGDV